MVMLLLLHVFALASGAELDAYIGVVEHAVVMFGAAVLVQGNAHLTGTLVTDVAAPAVVLVGTAFAVHAVARDSGAVDVGTVRR